MFSVHCCTQLQVVCMLYIAANVIYIYIYIYILLLVVAVQAECECSV